MHPSRTSRRPQARTEATKARILDAAFELFSELGFENTQLDEVAARAGCSRGGIYAHYSSKEDVFLALMAHRFANSFQVVGQRLSAEPDRIARRNIFKRWLVDRVAAADSGTLSLEFKLYAIRRPEKHAELLRLYNSLFASTHGSSLELLFAPGLTGPLRRDIERRLNALGGAVSGLILERHFRPGMYEPKDLERYAEEIFDALLPASLSEQEPAE